MATSPTSQMIQHLRRVLQDGVELTDGQLLGCFIERRDEAAFAVLVKRHGPMVWNVCRRLLNQHDAEDAFQATFLVLCRKAASIRHRETVPSWLHGVAHQTALQARRAIARRTAREKQVLDMAEPVVVEQEPWHDLQPLLDQELRRLPDRYRVVIVACDLEGKTRKEAARLLGCPEGTVAGRLARARMMLAKRLARHGVVVSAGTLAAVLSQKAASACVPASVMSFTIKAAGLFAAGQAAGATSIKAAALAEGVLKAMLLNKLKTVATGLLMMAVIGVVGGLCTYQSPRAQPDRGRPESGTLGSTVAGIRGGRDVGARPEGKGTVETVRQVVSES
jgi:RNA polymerase sigma factor (sigma-70 family)